ncbi:MAG: hypothetical protein A3G34_00115 [Candidatus Lindowbacteria bacterium RIFCSPLOWO2_12_FULL_62_27]|nr:MAG: hypothetical protein A3G34_00115 [Candidatus Lindowbacteria bacterium RIFCSPLOWO2_12_FULL_62_27]OGH56689.1 MAG: hypothetical protein A3I06_07555 [Candidatus Lindowbacteria bacterium RIFCSPLOWO2_02_FULL_62_12]
MTDKHTVLFIGRGQTYDDLKLYLQNLKEIELHHEDVAAVEEMKNGHSDILMIEYAKNHENTCGLLEELCARYPDCILLLMAPQKPGPEQLMQYMKCGVRDIVTPDDNLEAFLQKAVALIHRRSEAGRPGAGRLGRVLCFFSSKGGVGKTFLAVSAGRVLGQSPERRTVLVDFDLQFGDMDLYLDANSPRTIGELFEEVRNNGDRLSDFILDSHVHPVTPTLHLLSAPLSPEKAESIQSGSVVQLIKALKKRYDFVVLDAGGVLNDIALAAFDKADRIFLVVNGEIASIKNAGQTFQLLKKLNYDETRIDFVVNAVSETFPLDEGTLMKILTRKPVARIPASARVRESINQGYNLVLKKPEDPAVRGIREFCGKIAADFNVRLDLRDRPSGFWGRLFKAGAA